MPVSDFPSAPTLICVCMCACACMCICVCMQWVIYELRLDCESPVDSCWLPFTPERTHVLMRINVLWHPLGVWQPPEGLMKKYNLAKREGGISKGSLRPQERAYREGMDKQRRWRSRVYTELEQKQLGFSWTCIILWLFFVFCFSSDVGCLSYVHQYNDLHC